MAGVNGEGGWRMAMVFVTNLYQLMPSPQNETTLNYTTMFLYSDLIYLEWEGSEYFFFPCGSIAKIIEKHWPREAIHANLVMDSYVFLCSIISH